MEFKCLTCGRKEVIVGDVTPHCLSCGIPMVREITSYKNLWMSPRIVITRLKTIIEKHGLEAATTSNRFKKEREGWTTGLFALGLSDTQKKPWWVEIETVEQTPDTRVHNIDQSRGNNVINTQSIEIVDWEEHVDDVIQVIREKCQQAYPPHYCLLVLARNGKNLDLEKLMQQVSDEKVPFAEMWVLGIPSEGMATMLRIVPNYFRLDFKIASTLDKVKDQTDFMLKQKRGTSTEFQNLGYVYLPLP